ncbi:apolipoprotein C-I-like isoform X2 [Bufo bufo]|uniref:apolipoprotein C-I-like isoform X2 n=1 Tax=Bufo bufo TaxID=8384 RepID=UPI001ABEAB01|nr:apolipoprotein C-I-like isoform X2 [Bufo bufo]
MVFFPTVVKMKLLLALSVVLIALSVLAEPSSAESQEPSVKEKFKNIGEAIKDAAVKVGEKAKSVYKDLHESEIGTKTRNFFTESFQKIKNKFSK